MLHSYSLFEAQIDSVQTTGNLASCAPHESSDDRVGFGNEGSLDLKGAYPNACDSFFIKFLGVSTPNLSITDNAHSAPAHLTFHRF